MGSSNEVHDDKRRSVYIAPKYNGQGGVCRVPGLWFGLSTTLFALRPSIATMITRDHTTYSFLVGCLTEVTRTLSKIKIA